ncbi:MAG: glycosyl hydrolase family 28-related protein [Candidatus Hydrogenedentales bacterium]|jgi:hypothetical protein
MTRFSGLMLCLLAICLTAEAAPETAEIRLIDAKYPVEDRIIASAVVEAPATAGEDATEAIQSAIDTVAALGGGTVFLPEGRYLLKGHLLLRNAVTLRGEWLPPDKEGVVGTILMPVEHRGNAEGESAIVMQCGSGLRELSIWYPEQKPDAIVPYPWTIETSPAAGADNYTLHNVTLVNVYRGFKTGPESNELHTLKNVYMTALETGVFIDSCTDIGRIIDIDISPRWWLESKLPGSPDSETAAAGLRAEVAREATAIDMGRSDWEYLYGLHIEGYQRGLVIRQGAQGTTNAVLYGSILENCGTAVHLEKLNGIGLAAVGCRFEGFQHAVYATAAFDTVSQFNTCTFSSPEGHNVLLEGDGMLTFQNCVFEAWKTAGVEAAAGAVSLLGCEFQGAAGHVKLGERVNRARLLGNRFSGQADIENATTNADLMITHHAMSFDVPDVSRPPAPPTPAPASRDVVLATDYGARPDLDDNTKAFQEALAAAERLGGATVYVPAGYYRFHGSLTIPAGVELRGCFDVPHHTQSGGSVLMPIGGQGDEGGAPFIALSATSGLRGLTIWYPEQNLLDMQPYPWAVRSLGPACWLINVTISNAWQGVDFWTHPSEGHYISYLGGAFLRRGLFVSKSAGDGWVVDVQMNPHYGLRLPNDLPRPAYNGNTFEAIIDQQRGNLEAMIFGRCAREHIYRTFLYAAYDGIAFRDDEGGSNARILMHGTDTGSRCAVLSACGDEGLDFILAQLVPLGKYEVGAIIAEEQFTGRARFFTSQMWAGHCSGQLDGAGSVLIQQLNSISGGITCRAGAFRLENAVFHHALEPHVAIGRGCMKAELLANTALSGAFTVENAAGDRVGCLANTVSQRPASFEAGALATGWEADDPQGLANTLAAEGGGLRGVEEGFCAPVDGTSQHGARALRVAGEARDREHSYLYFSLFEEPLRIYSDTQLRYWFLPVNEAGQHVAVDMFFDDGTMLRDSRIKTAEGVNIHPGTPKGVVGEWQPVTVPLGRHAGKSVRRIMAAYDQRGATGPFEAHIDDLEITTAVIPELAGLAVSPRGGPCSADARVSFDVPAGFRVRYSLDGIKPGADAPHYVEPIAFPGPGLWDLRYIVEKPDGAPLPWVFGELYDVR